MSTSMQLRAQMLSINLLSCCKCIHLCNPNPFQNSEHYNNSRKSPHMPLSKSGPLYPSGVTTVLIMLPHRLNLLILNLNVNDTIQSIMLLSFSMLLRLLHVVFICGSFLCFAEYSLYEYVTVLWCFFFSLSC